MTKEEFIKYILIKASEAGVDIGNITDVLGTAYDEITPFLTNAQKQAIKNWNANKEVEAKTA